jgi:hypothetical protein
MPCKYTKCDYDNELYHQEIGVDLGIIEGSRFEIFTSKDHIHPIDEENALLEVHLLEVFGDKAARTTRIRIS